jgi:ElaB/YqjD/DUF883 family membrane-anchored ribosome-binding protein
MGLADRLRNLTKKAEDTAVEHKDQIHQAVQKAEAAADTRTGGKYHDKIAKAGDMADAYVDKLKPAEGQPAATDEGARPAPKAPAGE